MKGWKTIAFNVLSGIMLIVAQQGDMWNLSPDVVAGVAIIGNFILRFFTTTAIGKNN